MTVIGKYNLCERNEPPMAVRRFTWLTDGQDNVLLQWEWPADPSVKLMLVFDFEDEDPDINRFLTEGRAHAVVARDLADRYQTPVTGSRRRYLICPAYFDERKTVTVYQPALATDWRYKKTRVYARVQYEPLRMSRYKRVKLTLRFSEDGRAEEFLTRGLSYGIYDNNRLSGRYPLDYDVAAGRGCFYIRNDQQVRFITEDGYAHLLDIRIES